MSKPIPVDESGEGGEGSDEDDEPYVRLCTPQTRKAGKKCISLYDCRYDIGIVMSRLFFLHPLLLSRLL
jgi:hypothetical protein